MEKMEKLKELMKDKTFVEKMLKNETPEEAKAFFAEHGVELTLDEVKAMGKAIATAAKGGELSEAELADVAGGELIWSLDDHTARKTIFKDLQEGNYGSAILGIVCNSITW